MLTVSRRDGEGITFMLPSGEYIHVIVKSAIRGHTRLTCSAPANVKIWRDEVLEKASTWEGDDKDL